MATRTNRNAILATAILLASFAFMSCGGNGDKLTPQPDAPSSNGIVTVPSAMGPAPLVTQPDIAAARQELANMSVPVGIERDDWLALGEALIASLEERADRSVSKLPDEERNMIDDLTWVDKGGGDFDLTWTLKNAGDYDSNGEVNVADLTPIGMHLGKNEGSSDWDSAQAADGDGNGEVNIADVSPIGSNFQSQVLGYNVYSSQFETGPWLLKGSLEIGDASSGFPRMFTYPYGAQDAFVTVSPFDASGVDNVQLSGGTAAKYIPGETITPGPSAMAGPDTAAMLEGEPGTPLEGVTVDFPAGARVESTSISIGYSDGQVLPVVGEWSGVVLDISGPSDLLFEEPVHITVPFSGAADEYPVPYYIHEDGGLEDCLITDIDRTAGSMTFMTMHASLYTWIIAKVNDLDKDYSVPGFTPGDYGFQIVNWGSSYNPGGECMGMAGFSQWYFRNFRSEGDLFPRFMYLLGTGADSYPVTGQDAIATRAHNSLIRFWMRYLPSVDFDSTPAEEWVLIRHAILNNAAPTLLYLTDVNGGAAHAVLAYGWVGNNLLVYDVNRPNQIINVAYADNEFSGYGSSYVNFRNTGMGSMMREDFTLILADAEGQFSGTADVEITGLNYDSGDTVTKRTITLTGNLESSQVLADRLSINTGFSIVDAEVDPISQTFEAEVPIRPGDNFLKFISKGVVSGSNVVNIPNNYSSTRGLYLAGDFEPEKLRITLTWDEDNSFGMWVQDPTGDWVNGTWPRAGGAGDVPMTADGGYIDGPFHSGGPLHFIIPDSGTLRSGDYRFRVANRSPDDQFEVTAANWQVSVSFNDGPPQIFTGRLEEGSWYKYWNIDSEHPSMTEWFTVTNN